MFQKLHLVIYSVTYSVNSASDVEIRMGLNEDLVIGRAERRHGYGTVVLDDCNFHESANLENFEKERSLSIMAPGGEVCVVLQWNLSPGGEACVYSGTSL